MKKNKKYKLEDISVVGIYHCKSYEDVDGGQSTRYTYEFNRYKFVLKTELENKAFGDRGNYLTCLDGQCYPMFMDGNKSCALNAQSIFYLLDDEQENPLYKDKLYTISDLLEFEVKIYRNKQTDNSNPSKLDSITW